MRQTCGRGHRPAQRRSGVSAAAPCAAAWSSARGQKRKATGSSKELPVRESMEFDVVIVGAGPAGLGAAIRLKQLGANLSVVVLEKGSEVGAHIRHRPIGLDRLIPEWRTDPEMPLKTPVSKDRYLVLTATGGHGPAELANAARSRQSRQFRRLPWESCPLARQVRGIAGRRDLSGIRGWRGTLWRRRGNGRRSDRRHGRRARWKAEIQLHPRHEVRGKYTLLAEGAPVFNKANRRAFQAGRGPRPAEIRNRPQGIVADQSQSVSGRPDATHPQLAAHGWREWTLASPSLRRQPGLERWGCSAGPATRFSTATRWRPSWQRCWG